MPKFDAKTREEAEQRIASYLAPIVGQTITEIRADAEHHSLDSVYGPGAVTLTLGTGGSVTFAAQWCNDSTADLDIDLKS